ncbi:hypothetical protein N7478_009943 [Penicillium angulare]|uniref:uncharacterized protein n=1 Tax=Penicillium angulare TaxID=116970 RepID=UPI0025420B6D|nr:uncharacterized protein N7478_009943 [Penicillium angulare]KAJ5267135.1 hypothetical protein N7478_009943 [Penicillium angulare]
MAASVIQLQCDCKNDPWGKKGGESLAGRLWSQMPDASPLDQSQTYSEMWMGTYPSVPSRLASSGELLQDHIKNNPELLGSRFCDRYSTEVPFLPKILSFEKALPLQLHPDKKLAEKLHAYDSTKFGDSNHKPEIAVALTRFELFVGFKPIEELREIIRLGPLQEILPKYEHVDEKALRETCRALLKLSERDASSIIDKLKHLPASDLGAKHQHIPKLVERLSEQYSESDNGILIASLLMNYMALEPGEAVCVPADSIHAWLSGDILECMARSDNVLNTGFCPRADRDNINLFTQALTFKPQGQEASLLQGQPSSFGSTQKTVEYAPPFSEFNVLGVSLNGKEMETHAVLHSPSILVVTEGSGIMATGQADNYDLREGSVFFAGPEAKLQFATHGSLNIYRAYATL